MKKFELALVILMVAISLAFTGCKGTTPAGPAQLTVEVFDRGTDGGKSLAYDNAWTDWIKEKVLTDLNIKVTFVPVGRWSENIDIVNLMASGTAPDLCYTYALEMIANFRDQGGILDLAPYIDSYLPDLKKLLGEDTALQGKEFIYRQADPQTGSIYSIQSYRVSLAERNFFIRKDWLDKLGLPLPTNIQEFHDALIAFRDQDPGNVGRNRVVPYGQNEDTRWGLQDLINHSVNPNMSDRDRWVNNVAERFLLYPGYKEGVRMANQWYNERLIYQDFPLMTVADNFYNQMRSGVVGSFSQNWDLPYRQDYKINEELAINVPGAEFVPVDIVRNKLMYDKGGLYIFIPSFSKNHEAALRYLNWLAKPENFHFIQVGQEGVNHTIVNGVPNVTGRPAGDPWFMNSSNNIDYTMPINGVELGSTELNVRVLALSYGNIPADTIVNAYTLSTRNARARPVYQVPTRVNQYAQTLQDKSMALHAQAITARPADFDRIWEAGIADWLASGAQEVLNERASLWK